MTLSTTLVFPLIASNLSKKVAYHCAVFDRRPNSNGIYLTSDEDSEVQRLHYFDLNQDRVIETITNDIHWDVTYEFQIHTSKQTQITNHTLVMKRSRTMD